jgi:hypothetical protein
MRSSRQTRQQRATSSQRRAKNRPISTVRFTIVGANPKPQKIRSNLNEPKSQLTDE